MNKKAKSLLFTSIIFSVVSVLLLCILFADMSSTLNSLAGPTYYSNALNKTLTFVVTAGSESADFGIRQVNFTLAVGLNFTFGSNSTNSIASFTNVSTSVINTNISFGSGPIIIPNGTSKTFTFNVTTILDGSYTIAVNTSDANWAKNSTKYTIVVDTTYPVPALRNPLKNQNFTSKLIFINATFAEDNYNYSLIEIYGVSGLVNSTTNSTIGNFTTNLSVSADGVYTVNITVYDKAGNSNITSNKTITVDSTAPAVSAFVAPASANTYSASLDVIPLNISIVDATLGTLSSVKYNITNASGYQKAIFNTDILVLATVPYCSNLTGLNVSNTTAGALSYPDGRYIIKLLSNDTLNNFATNVEIGNITIDRTAPSTIKTVAQTTGQTAVNFSITIDDATSGVSSVCVADRASAVESVGNGTLQYVYESGLTCNTAYSYVVNCTDNSGNKNSTGTYTVTTSACDAAASTSSGGASASALTFKASLATTGTSTSRSLRANDAIRLLLANGENHTVTVKSLTSTSATISVASTPQDITLNVGETKKVDLNADGTYDLSIKLGSIANKFYAALVITKISEAYTLTPGTTGETPTSSGTTDTSDTTETSSTAKSGSTLWWIIGVIVVIVLAVVIYLATKSKSRRY